MVERLQAYQKGLCSVEALTHVDWIHMAHDSTWLWSVMMYRAINRQIPSIYDVVQPQDTTQYTVETQSNCTQAVMPIWQSIAVHIGLAVITVRPTASKPVIN
jgi:hypothetical protein